MTRDEMKISLCNEIYALVDMYGLTPDDNLASIATALTRYICVDAPDRQTAEYWHKMFCKAVKRTMNEAARDGQAKWSRQRCH